MLIRSRSFNKKIVFLLRTFILAGLLLLISTSFWQYQYIINSTNIIIQNQSPLTIKTQLVHVKKKIIVPLKLPSIRCIVFARFRTGRFGNRMFTMATAYALARLHSCHLFFSPIMLQEIRSIFVFTLPPILLSIPMFKMVLKNSSHPMKKITRDIICQYLPELTYPNAIGEGSIFEVKGHWQSYLHFDKYRDELRNHLFVARQSLLEKVSKLFSNIYEQKFHFKPQFSLENHQLFKKQLTQSNWTTWIGIHIRRDDFVPLNFSSSDEYLFAAIDYYMRRYPNAHFIVASDDKSYCKNLFRHRSNIIVTPKSFSMGDDLIALSLCEHSIITGGTFGWWTGYLASGEVIHDTMYISGCEKDEHYYPPWFKTHLNLRKDKNIL
ncbi:unnamed protein product [Rotaria sp. Silwood1]|nr:unnamed protein product [Rotaria sp. Silwood1]CAF1459615.1 unnamed protein product [Rotaria sp. Silwood1]CAF3636563.1 unnamed protein product [Rotaria sp. Silwood1]CAF3689937.1 unnamed protein product [Rotaria sp. Silwood1]CAF4866542.1 unnamed protein product [Rotaria sp. Silwood1]